MPTEIRKKFSSQTGMRPHISTVCKVVQRLGFSRNQVVWRPFITAFAGAIPHARPLTRTKHALTRSKHALRALTSHAAHIFDAPIERYYLSSKKHAHL